MLYFITGASGSGKTACIQDLKQALPKAAIYDFDDIGVPKDADTVWRQQATEQWLQRYLKERENVDHFCICGGAVLGEILACPSATQLDNINVCFLDVSDLERIRRLQSRGMGGVNQDMLNWASWLRVHHADPQWQQHVIQHNAWSGLDFSRWDNLDSWKSLAKVTTLDTTDMSIVQVVMGLVDWIKGVK
ncbi:MAG: hypothetical protein ABFQ95_06675 [Pseudomonadota bacterium]